MKEYKFDPNNIWFVSDMHINHKNIIEYSHRPFKNVDEMNETLINNWNNTVTEDGIVFDLGDFAIGGSKVWNDALSRLHGKHYLILGNHDRMNAELEKQFVWVKEMETVKDGENHVVLCIYRLFHN